MKENIIWLESSDCSSLAPYWIWNMYTHSPESLPPNHQIEHDQANSVYLKHCLQTLNGCGCWLLKMSWNHPWFLARRVAWIARHFQRTPLDIDGVHKGWREGCSKSLFRPSKVLTLSGWWYTYPSEKYESQLGWWHSQYMENKKCSKPPTSKCWAGDNPTF